MTPDKSIEEIIKDEQELIKEFTLKFFFWWYNQKGTNTYQGFDSYMKTVEGKLEFNKFIAGRSKSIESEKAKDERIKELKEELGKAIKVIKQWHNADEVWDIYFNNAPEMKSIRELLNNK